MSVGDLQERPDGASAGRTGHAVFTRNPILERHRTAAGGKQRKRDPWRRHQPLSVQGGQTSLAFPELSTPKTAEITRPVPSAARTLEPRPLARSCNFSPRLSSARCLDYPYGTTLSPRIVFPLLNVPKGRAIDAGYLLLHSCFCLFLTDTLFKPTKCQRPMQAKVTDSRRPVLCLQVYRWCP